MCHPFLPLENTVVGERSDHTTSIAFRHLLPNSARKLPTSSEHSFFTVGVFLSSSSPFLSVANPNDLTTTRDILFSAVDAECTFATCNNGQGVLIGRDLTKETETFSATKTGKLPALRRTHCSDKLLRLQLSNCGTTASHNPFVRSCTRPFCDRCNNDPSFCPRPPPPPPQAPRGGGGGVNWKTVYI